MLGIQQKKLITDIKTIREIDCKMKVLLNSLNYAPELTGIGKYNDEMCQAFVKNGIDVTAIIAPPYYPEWQVSPGYRKFWYQKSKVHGVKLIRCPLYVPNDVTTIKRFIHLCSFAFTAALAIITQLFNRPNIVMLVQPTLFCAPFALIFAKLIGAKTIMHIQDFEVDAMFGLGMAREGKIKNVAKWLESWLLKRFDAISTISYSMIEITKAKGVDERKIIYFPNWSDIEFVTPNSDGSALKKEWGFKASDTVILYAGNIGHKQGLEMVLEAAQYYREQTNIKFLLVGAGSYAATLKDLAVRQELNNVFFKPLQPWANVPQMLALADIHLVVQKKGAADAVLPSKLTNILSAGGHALVTAERHTELGAIAEKHVGVFHRVEPENILAFINGISHLLNENLTTHNIVARRFAESNLAKNKILKQFVANLTLLIKTPHILH
jgi:colanic acid biosynthesis glycosyl transferase WcaI